MSDNVIVEIVGTPIVIEVGVAGPPGPTTEGTITSDNGTLIVTTTGDVTDLKINPSSSQILGNVQAGQVSAFNFQTATVLIQEGITFQTGAEQGYIIMSATGFGDFEWAQLASDGSISIIQQFFDGPKNTFSINTAHTNSWTALQSFANNTLNFGGATVNVSGLTAGNVLLYNGTNWINLAPTSFLVVNVANSDGTLTVSPNLGNVVASLNLAHANTWTGLQTFGNNISIAGVQFNVSSLVAGNMLIYDGTHWVNEAPPSFLVTGLSNTDGSIVVSGSVGAVNIKLNTVGSVAGKFLCSSGSGAAAIWSTALTGISVASANGLAGTSSGGSTPALTLSTSVTGMLKGNGTAISAGTSGTDYSSGTSALATGILKSTTTTGALSIATASDFPTLNQNTTGNAATVTTNANLTGNVTSVGNATTIASGVVTNAMLSGSIAASKLVGTDITTVGTIASGTWNGTTIAIANGGTGQTSAANAINALLPSQTGNSGDVLTTNGTACSWQAPSGGGGGGFNPYNTFTDPTTYTWSWLNQAGCTITSPQAATLYLEQATGSSGAGQVNYGRQKALPTGSTWTATMAFMPNANFSMQSGGFGAGAGGVNDNLRFGMCLVDTGGAVLETWNVNSSSSGNIVQCCIMQTGPAGATNNGNGNICIIPSPVVWMRLVYTGSQYKAYISNDGFAWNWWFVQSSTSWITQNKIGFFIGSTSPSSAGCAYGMRVLSWAETSP